MPNTCITSIVFAQTMFEKIIESKINLRLKQFYKHRPICVFRVPYMVSIFAFVELHVTLFVLADMYKEIRTNTLL